MCWVEGAICGEWLEMQQRTIILYIKKPEEEEKEEEKEDFNIKTYCNL